MKSDPVDEAGEDSEDSAILNSILDEEDSEDDVQEPKTEVMLELQ